MSAQERKPSLDTAVSPDVEAGEKAIPAAPPRDVIPDGGLKAWMCVLGSTLVLFSTFGYANAFGVYQAYYQLQGFPNETASNISWIGSIQLFLQFALGAVTGPLYAKGYFRPMVYFGTALYIVCLFMISLCHKFWQVILCQGVGLGIAIGFLFLPSVSIISQYFLQKRATALGLVTAGSSLGGIILPIMLNRLIASQGFPKAVRATGYLMIGTLVLACLLIHPRVIPAGTGPAPPKPTPKEIFSSRPYSVFVAGAFFVTWGLFFPIYYLEVFADAKGIDPKLTTYTLAILNAASVFGRTLPNVFADRVGSLNTMTFMCICTGVLCFSVFGATSSAGLIIVAILFGFFSGAYISLLAPVLASFAKNFNEIGIRLGMAFVVISLAALSGTPICGQLLEKYGFGAPIGFSGATVLVGSVFLMASRTLQSKEKGTARV